VVFTHDKGISSRTQSIVKLRDGKVVDGDEVISSFFRFVNQSNFLTQHQIASKKHF